MSGVRYHQVTDEKFAQLSCYSKFGKYDKCLKNDTYQSYISRVPLDEKIRFEMRHIGKRTNNGIINLNFQFMCFFFPAKEQISKRF